MKIAIIGAAGLRTPLIVQSILARQDVLGVHELALMDIDADRLELIGGLTLPIEQQPGTNFRITRTTDATLALENADYVITTFRVGGMESRIIDERVPLSHGVIGQETTGPGGFAMGIRSIPVILEYVDLMKELCPNAWLINFANPAGMLAEAVINHADWKRAVGICDAPTSMGVVIASILKANPDDVYLDYFGLNHLGWIRRVIVHHQDYLPKLLDWVRNVNELPGLPFDPALIYSLGMIPNEYLYYYYYSNQAVRNSLAMGESRGERIMKLNLDLYTKLRDRLSKHDIDGMQDAYKNYLKVRGNTYMVNETGKPHDDSILDPEILALIENEGYASVALKLIEALNGNTPVVQILNIPNAGAITQMDENDVVEIPALVYSGQIQPLAVGEIPPHCIGLMKQIKHYEQLTIEATVNKSYEKAHMALTVHPLVRDFNLAGQILDEYIQKHKGYFPELN